MCSPVLCQRKPFQLVLSAKRGRLGVTTLSTSLSLQKRLSLYPLQVLTLRLFTIDCVAIDCPSHSSVNGEYQVLILDSGNLPSNCSGPSEVLSWGSFWSFAGGGWEKLNIKPSIDSLFLILYWRKLSPRRWASLMWLLNSAFTKE